MSLYLDPLFEASIYDQQVSPNSRFPSFYGRGTREITSALNKPNNGGLFS